MPISELDANKSSQDKNCMNKGQVRVLLEPPGKIIILPRPKTAAQLLAALDLPEETAIIARNGELLTPDRRIWPNDELLVRITSSRG